MSRHRCSAKKGNSMQWPQFGSKRRKQVFELYSTTSQVKFVDFRFKKIFEANYEDIYDI